MKRALFWLLPLATVAAAGCRAGSPSAEAGEGIGIVHLPPPITPVAVTGMIEADPPEMYVAFSNGAVRRAIFDFADAGHGAEGHFDDFPNIRAISAFTTARFERSRHLVVLDKIGDVYVDQFLARGAVNQRMIANVPNATLVAGYGVGWDDPFDHVFVASADGVIHEFDITDGSPNVDTPSPCLYFGPLVSMSAYYNWTERTGHIVVVTARGAVYDVHVDPLLLRSGCFQTDVVGSAPGATYASAYADKNGLNHLLWSTASGVVNETVFGVGVRPQTTAQPGSLGGLSNFGVVPHADGTATAVAVVNTGINALYGQLVNYNVLTEPLSLDRAFGSTPDFEIELSFCLNDINRAALQQSVMDKIAGISNDQVRAYFASASFHSQCIGFHERGGVYAMDPSDASRTVGFAEERGRLSSDYPVAFNMKAQLLRDLTATVFQQLQQQPHSVSLDDYTLSLDSSGHDTISLHVNADYDLYGIHIPLNADYTDKLHIDDNGNLLCDTSHSTGAPDEPTVGALAAGVLPAMVPFNGKQVPVTYHLIDISGSGGLYVEASIF